MASLPSDLPGPYQTALVTGASSGIGQAVATRLVEAGLTVYGTSRYPQDPGRVPGVQWLTLDGTRPDAVDGFIQQHDKLLTSLDLLINNAGSSGFGKLIEMDPTSLEAQLNLLLKTPAALCQRVLPGMRNRGRGAVVNVSSLAAECPLPYMALYTAGKAGLSAFTQGLILTEEAKGVVIIDYRPGDYRTAFRRAMGDDTELTEREKLVLQEMEAQMEKGPQPGHAAEAILKAIRKGKSRTVVSGGFFQKWVAPLGWRFLPRSLFLRTIRRYYGLAG